MKNGNVFRELFWTFKTNPPHDSRTHRSQGDDKKPFTATELQAKGLEKL